MNTLNKNAQALGSLGGKARANVLTKEVRSWIAAKGGKATAGKPRKRSKEKGSKMNQNDRTLNPDWIERQKPCDICGDKIGDEAMYTEPGARYHARCVCVKTETRAP